MTELKNDRYLRALLRQPADCVTGLNEIGQISVSNISGDPQDVERIVALKADEQGASWYRIITMYEDQQPDNWRVQAILYA